VDEAAAAVTRTYPKGTPDAARDRVLESEPMLRPFFLFVALAAAQTTYEYFLTGSPADVQTATKPGFALVGGGKDQDAVMRWFLERSGGGDVVVLRASGGDGYNPYLNGLGKLDSVESIVVNTPEAARDPFVAGKIRAAEAVFIAGGDQWNYVRIWRGSPVGNAIQAQIDRGIPVGGTSAGLAVLGEFVFTAEKDTVTSKQALADPFDEHVTVGRDFLRIPALRNTITDSHFHARDRMGRTLAFLARMLEPGKLPEARAIAIDERTAALVDPDGKAKVEGEGVVYFIRANRPAAICKPGVPLTFAGMSVSRVPSGGSFDLRTWTGRGGTTYELSVDAGVIRSTQNGGGIY
jgi:cyanophycinase